MDAKHSGMINDYTVLWRLGKRRGRLSRGGMAEWGRLWDKFDFPLLGLFKPNLRLSIRGWRRLGVGGRWPTSLR